MRGNHDTYDDTILRAALRTVRTIAMVGASANTARPSYFVLRYLLSKNYDVIPVNPGHAGREIAGARVSRSLAEIDRSVDMVDIFRNSRAAYAVVVEALALDPLPRVIWMQLGVRNEAAAALAESRGVTVIMNRCPKIEYARLCGEIGWAGVPSRVISARKPKLDTGFQRYGLVDRER
jgi:uncharacterized protein